MDKNAERRSGEVLESSMVGDDGLTGGEREKLARAYFEKQGGFDLPEEILSKIDSAP